MSLITRCPACGTMFKVVSDQLKVSQGWVRCGQCAAVFDASLHLQSSLPQSTSDVPPNVPAFTAPAATSRPDEAVDISYAQEVEAALKTPVDMAPDLVSVALPLVSSPAELVAGQASPEQAIDLVTDQIADSSTDSELNDVSFVRDARRQAFWRKPLVRTVLPLVAVSLLLLLGAQLAVQQRDALLAFEPRLKPFLLLMCEPLACDLGSTRRIEAIVIDNSSFNKTNEAGGYSLSFSLKNTGNSVVAMPSLEVSLTDLQDQTVIRRVLSPAQFGASSGALLASSEFSSTVFLQVKQGSPTVRIAGYRLLAFYP